MGKIITIGHLDVYTDYDIVDTKHECVIVTDNYSDISDKLQIVFYYQQYTQFGILYYHIQFLDVKFEYY